MAITGMDILLGVTNMDASMRFYRDSIGFSVVSQNESGHSEEDRQLEWAHLAYGEASLQISLHGAIADTPQQRAGRSAISLRFNCEDVPSLHTFLQQRGCRWGRCR